MHDADSLDIMPSDLVHPFWLFTWDDVNHMHVFFTCIVLYVSGILCSAAGIGGGGVFVAVLMVVGKLTPHNAVPLSKAIVFFGAVASFNVNLRRAYDKNNATPNSKPVIDFVACRLVVPAALVGTFGGVLLNWHIKDYQLVLLLTAVLVFMTVLVVKQAYQQYQQEENALDAQTLNSQELGNRFNHQTFNDDEETELSRLIPQGNRQETPIADVVPLDKKSPTTTDIILSGSLLWIVVMSGIIRFHMHACGAEKAGTTSGQSACQHPIILSLFGGLAEHWMADSASASRITQALICVPVFTCLTIAVFCGHEAVEHHKWSVRAVLAYESVALVTGVLAGLVGVGGGLILSPFFLLSGMEPTVAIGTSSTCVLFTSSSTTIQYLFTDRIVMSLAIVYGLTTLIASYTGTTLVLSLQDRFSRRSYISSIVALGVGLSALFSLVKFVYLIASSQGDDS